MGRHAIRKTGPLDQLSLSARDLLIEITPAVLAWLSTEVVPALEGEFGKTLAGALAIQLLVRLLTPLTRQYGVGAPPAQSSDDPH